MYAIKNGVSFITQDTMNEFLQLQNFTLLYEGSWFDSYTTGGTYAHDLSTAYFAVKLPNLSSAAITRVEILVEKDSGGAGSDMTVSLMGTDFDPGGSDEGTVLCTWTIPKEFISTSATYVSIPINTAGLTTGAGVHYWLKVAKAGDATNHLHLKAYAGMDATHKSYSRAGTSGAWTEVNSINFHAIAGISGAVYHVIYATNGLVTISYSSGKISRIYFYLPPSDGAAGGIRDYIDITWSGANISYGKVTSA